ARDRAEGVRDQARADAERAAGAFDRAGPSITPQALKTFASQARRRTRTESGGYRRDHLRALAAHRSGRERSSHRGLEQRTAAYARRRRLKHKIGNVWSAQFCTEVARSERFELPTLGFEVRCS